MSTLNLSDWFAGLALLIALTTAFFQFRDYYFRIRMRVLDYIVPYVHGQLSLVAVRLALVNPSSKAASVCHIDIKSSLRDVPVIPVHLEYSEDFQTSYYRLDNDDSEYRFQMPTSELLRIPVDILPHQSLNKWLVFSVELPKWAFERRENIVTILEFSAFDHRYNVWKQKGKVSSCWKQALVGKKFSASWPYT